MFSRFDDQYSLRVSFTDGKAEPHYRRNHSGVKRPLTVHNVPDAVQDQ